MNEQTASINELWAIVQEQRQQITAQQAAIETLMGERVRAPVGGRHPRADAGDMPAGVGGTRAVLTDAPAGEQHMRVEATESSPGRRRFSRASLFKVATAGAVGVVAAEVSGVLNPTGAAASATSDTNFIADGTPSGFFNTSEGFATLYDPKVRFKYDYGVQVQADICGVYGESTATYSSNPNPPHRSGVYGLGDNVGVYGQSHVNGTGVTGYATGTNSIGGAFVGDYRAVSAVTTASTGTAIYANANSVTNFAIDASNAGSGGTAVSARALGGGTGLYASGGTYGVLGDGGTSAPGVYGIGSTGVLGGCTSSTGYAMHAKNTGSGGTAIFAEATGGGTGVYGIGETYALLGTSTNGQGMRAVSSNGYGSQGMSSTNYGALGQSDSSHGVGGYANGGYGFVGQSTNSVGMRASSIHNYGTVTSGGLAPIRLLPATTVGPPPATGHLLGELYVDKNGALYYFNGTVWKQIA